MLERYRMPRKSVDVVRGTHISERLVAVVWNTPQEHSLDRRRDYGQQGRKVWGDAKDD